MTLYSVQGFKPKPQERYAAQAFAAHWTQKRVAHSTQHGLRDSVALFFYMPTFSSKKMRAGPKRSLECALSCAIGCGHARLLTRVGAAHTASSPVRVTEHRCAVVVQAFRVHHDRFAKANRAGNGCHFIFNRKTWTEYNGIRFLLEKYPPY